MRPTGPIRGALAAAIVAVAAAGWLAQAAPAAPAEPVVPTRIAVPDGHKLFLVGHAAGVQIYRCGATAAGYGWGPATPRATLYDDAGRPIATHYAGPSWQAGDGSTAVGQRVDGVTVDAGAIQWLLLSASATPGADGDRLARTAFIQRINTAGGLAPAASACNALTADSKAEIAYSADYYFWKPRS